MSEGTEDKPAKETPQPVRNVWSPMELSKAVLYLITALAGLGIYTNTLDDKKLPSIATKEDLTKALEDSENRIIKAIDERLKAFE